MKQTRISFPVKAKPPKELAPVKPRNTALRSNNAIQVEQLHEDDPRWVDILRKARYARAGDLGLLATSVDANVHSPLRSPSGAIKQDT